MGRARGRQIRSYTVFEQLHRSNPEFYTGAFDVETRRRMNVDLRDGMYGGIRRQIPLLIDPADRGGLLRISRGESNIAGETVCQFPDTWEIRSKKGYWKRTVLRLLGSEYKGFGLKISTQRYVNPNGAKTRTRADQCDILKVDATLIQDSNSARSDRLYPAGKRLIEGEATKARYHSPQDEHGNSICWYFDAHSGCFRGACANSHVRMKQGPLRWCLRAEMIRRGGDRRFGKLCPPHDVDGVIRQLAGQITVGEANKRVSGDSTESTKKAEVGECPDSASAICNPVLPNAHERFGRFDFVQSGNRDIQLYYAAAEWADGEIRMGRSARDARGRTDGRSRN